MPQCLRVNALGELLRLREAEAVGLQVLDHCGDITLQAYRHPFLAAQGSAVEKVRGRA